MKSNRGIVCVVFLASTITHAAESSITLNAGEEPSVKQWTQPASVTYVSNDGKDDNWVIDVAGKYEWRPSQDYTSKMFVRSVVQRNTQAKSEVANYAAELGGTYEFDTASGPGIDPKAWYFPMIGSLGVGSKTLFKDPKATCTASPLPSACTDQKETYLRAKVAMQFFTSWMEDTFFIVDGQIGGPAWTHSLLPVVTVFYDKLLDAKRDATGFEPSGVVMGTKVALASAVSPKFTDYRLVLSSDIQYVNAFNRSGGRRRGFRNNSTLLKLSADYEFGPRSFSAEGSAGWVPAIGVTYTKGDDPLSGKLDQDSVVFGIKVTYRSQ